MSPSTDLIYTATERRGYRIVAASLCRGVLGMIIFAQAPPSVRTHRNRQFRMMKEERSDVRLMIEPVLSNVELEHDFLWRVHQATPAKGMIGIWNRSHYEDVLIARVHQLVKKKIWKGVSFNLSFHLFLLWLLFWFSSSTVRASCTRESARSNFIMFKWPASAACIRAKGVWE